MTRGRQTPIELKEKVRAIVATTGNYSEAERETGVSDTTARDIALSDDGFNEFREQVQKEYIVKTWQNILDIESALTQKITKGNLDRLQLRELTGALKDLKGTVENVVNNLVQIDNRTVNVTYSPEQSLADAFERIADEYRLTVDEVKQKFC
jgi:hypothetical protein